MTLSSAFALIRGEGAIQVKVHWLKNIYIYIYIYILIGKKNFIEKRVKHDKVEKDTKEIKRTCTKDRRIYKYWERFTRCETPKPRPIK